MDDLLKAPRASESWLNMAAPLEFGIQRRVEGHLKVSGEMPFAADLHVPDALAVAVLRSPHPHARILSIDTSAAEAVPGVACVLTGGDVAGKWTGRGLRDVPLLAVGKTRFIGEMVAAVAAESQEIAELALRHIVVEYEELPGVFGPVEALAPTAPAIHDKPWLYVGAVRTEDDPANFISRSRRIAGGDIQEAIARSERVFEHTFRTARVHQGYLEPHCCTVWLDQGFKAHVWSCNKSPYALRNQLAVTFDIPVEDVEVHTAAVGGDFGAKGSPMDIPLCLELSRRTGRPVRMLRNYTEELTAGDPAPGSVTTIRMGVTEDGTIQAFHMSTLLSAGAYGGFTPTAYSMMMGGTGYRLSAADVEVVRVYTNEVPNGSMRAPAAMQVVFAVEAMMDLVARELGLSPFEFRRRNLLRSGETTLTNDTWPEHRGIELLDLAEQSMRPLPPSLAGPNIRLGRGVALYDRPTHAPSRTSMRLRLAEGGLIEAEVPIQETGTGSHSMFQRVLGTLLEVDRDRIVIRYVGTRHLPFDSGVGGQRISVTAINACVKTVEKFRADLAERAAPVLGVRPEDIQMRQGGRLTNPAGRVLELAQLRMEVGSIESTCETAVPTHHDAGAINYCVQIAQVGVDIETGQVFVYDFLTAHDVAEIIEPVSHGGQIEGGVAMGLGFALSEDLSLVEGRVTASHLGEYKMFSVADMPALTSVFLTGGKGVGPLNVKAIGEMSNVPAAAAIANAVSDALGACMDTLPLTAERVFTARTATV